jgi:hypothetical protein
VLSTIVRELREGREGRLRAMMERDEQHQAAAVRRTDELFHAMCEMMQVEDWQGVLKDRYVHGVS